MKFALSLGINSVAVLNRSGGAPAPAAPTTPANWDFIAYGDSRTEDSVSGLLGAGGYVANHANLGPVGWLPSVSGGRLRLGLYPNFGISAQGTTRAAAIPRETWNGAATAALWYRPASNTNGSTNKGADYAASHPAGVVVFLLGTNDTAGDWPSTSRTNVTTILDNIGSSKLVVMLNETPEGVDVAGTTPGSSSGPSGDAFKAFSEWLSTLDYASGHANARSNVVVVDTWGEILDVGASSAGSWKNKVGYLRDGLHFTPYGSKKVAELIHSRLAAAFGSTYTNVAPRWSLPTANGFTTPSAVAPFCHTNPILTPGTAGTTSGTFASGPSTSTIPQGWALDGSGTLGGLTVVCDKTLTDSDGYPMWRITVSGTLADSSIATLTMRQTALATGQLANTDKVRGIGRLALAAGSEGVTSANITVFIQSGAGATTGLSGTALGGSIGAGTSGTAGRRGFLLNEGGVDAGGFDHVIMTQLFDLASPDMDVANGGPGNVTTITQAAIRAVLNFKNYTGSTRNVSAQLDISRCGMFRTAD